MLRSPASKPTTAPPWNVEASPHNLGLTGRPGVDAALVALRGYKLIVSPFFAGSCRFQPSCSEYMADAIRRHGLGRGVWLGVKRLSRCRPFGGHGIDPVPHS